MPYIHFTEEQKLRACEVDLVEFLRHQGEKLIRSGPEYRLASDHSVTVQGNEWYDHATESVRLWAGSASTGGTALRAGIGGETVQLYPAPPEPE